MEFCFLSGWARLSPHEVRVWWLLSAWSTREVLAVSDLLGRGVLGLGETRQEVTEEGEHRQG